ncbi:MAG: VanW family protein [Bacteroidota bacterium]
MKKLIPISSRVRLRVIFFYLLCLFDGTYFRMVSARNVNKREGKSFSPQLSLTQPIRKTSYSGNKVHNLKIAASNFQYLLIQPGEILSFWHMVGAPVSQRNFRVGRTIIGEELNTSVGGGLCQLAGILYHLGLQAGWEILERHAHSLDLYNDKNRYTPLGADASVCYGYKDLRMRNTCGIPVILRIEISDEEISAHFCGKHKVPQCEIEFIEKRKENLIYVKTLRFHPPAWKENLGVSCYKTFESTDSMEDTAKPDIPEKSPLSKDIEQQALKDWARSEIFSR